ncbi:hypothetical protein L873DRAFT_1292359 [Choiromyces venosus 120613-1]|uniref:Uncharacterized protein n=1 Tax=Choiromyces venosus 120613-1 TaxID=1336337 RepID=A0A3N4JFT5_9PEZI|nr:hypothetical protein L873DRAFT_1292359 [Choiromyces venosus 120613-1]
MFFSLQTYNNFPHTIDLCMFIGIYLASFWGQTYLHFLLLYSFPNFFLSYIEEIVLYIKRTSPLLLKRIKDQNTYRASHLKGRPIAFQNIMPYVSQVWAIS